MPPISFGRRRPGEAHLRFAICDLRWGKMGRSALNSRIRRDQASPLARRISVPLVIRQSAKQACMLNAVRTARPDFNQSALSSLCQKVLVHRLLNSLGFVAFKMSRLQGGPSRNGGTRSISRSIGDRGATKQPTHFHRNPPGRGEAQGI